MCVAIGLSLPFFAVVDDYGNLIELIDMEAGPRAALNFIYFAYPGESFYWGV